MLYFRSLLFNSAWYINLVLHMVLQMPWFFFLSHKQAIMIPKRWAWTNNWLHRVLVGAKMEVIGAENLPTEGCIVACKHQSTWEFYAVNSLLPDCSFVLKSELMRIPIFGWFLAKLDHIPIRRGDGGKAMRNMIKESGIRVDKNRQVLIFPEGTRGSPGADPNYRYGVTRMYMDLKCPVVPIALNAGLYWPRRKFLRYPGTIRVKILEPIMPGMAGRAFANELESRIEEGCDELYLLASKDDVCPPLSDAVKARIAVAEERLSAQSSK